jgi:hypothetical protein
VRHPQRYCLRKELEFQPNMVNFADGWCPVGMRFSKLRQFCGGIATVIPGTPTVESHFNVINREYDEVRGSLTEFSLAGILHSNRQAFCIAKAGLLHCSSKRPKHMKHSSAQRMLDILPYPFPVKRTKTQAIPYHPRPTPEID